MPELGSHDPCDNGHGNDANSIGGLTLPVKDVCAAETEVKHGCAADRRYPQHQSEGRNIPRTDVEEMSAEVKGKVKADVQVRQHTQ